MSFQSSLLKQDFNFTTQQSRNFGNINGSRCLRILMNLLSYLIRKCLVFHPFIVESSRRPINWQGIENSRLLSAKCIYKISRTYIHDHHCMFLNLLDSLIITEFENQGLNMTRNTSYNIYLCKPAQAMLQLQVSLKCLQTPSRLVSRVGPPETSMHLV